MVDTHVLRDILVIFSVSIGVVFLFRKLNLPSIAGFLVAGTVVGPYGLNLISDLDQIQVLADAAPLRILHGRRVNLRRAPVTGLPERLQRGALCQAADLLHGTCNRAAGQ